MQRSFSIVMDDDSGENDEDQDVKPLERRSSQIVTDFEKNLSRMAGHESLQGMPDYDQVGRDRQPSKLPSAGPSSRSRSMLKTHHLSSDSDSEGDEGEKKNTIPGEYDPKMYEHLDVNTEIKEVFQYITKYIPQTMSLDHKFRPFVPEFLPAVGDIDAFLKVMPPTAMVSGENFVVDQQQLGLVVLDEPAANQSDSALLHLQLRAESVNTTHDSDVVVKKLDNVEKNLKVIDKWIKDISALHKSKSFPVVRYSEPMPDLDELMQEWPEEMEKKLKENNFPEATGSLDEYVDEICELFQIPSKNKIEALHLLFSLYAAVKSSQLFKNSQLEKSEVNEEENVADQLVLD